jgi:pimeloyl-ACP methyl ester carboxylesterase
VRPSERASRTRSRDGTAIGYFSRGDGPPLLLVHGGLGDHTRWDVLRPHLEPHFTVHAMDRRGRGASGDHPDYALEREYEDVAAVIDAIARSSGSSVDVYGVSSGGHFAFGAAPLTSNLRRLVLYEGWPLADPKATSVPRELVQRIEAALEDGDPERALELLYRDYIGLSEEELATVREQSSWPGRVAAATTIPREIGPGADPELDPGRAARVTAPTLLPVGSESPEHLAAGAEAPLAVLPDARIAVLEGQGHAADLLAPELVAERMLAFLRGQP